MSLGLAARDAGIFFAVCMLFIMESEWKNLVRFLSRLKRSNSGGRKGNWLRKQFLMSILWIFEAVTLSPV